MTHEVAQMYALATLRRRLELRGEELLLKLLPFLTRNYLWVSADGSYLYGPRQYQKLLYRIFRGTYEPFTVNLFKRAVKPGMVVLDIGAHLGYYSLLAARRVGPQGKVYAFECAAPNYRFLLHNIKLNKFSKIIVPIPKAVADHAGVGPFFPRGRDLSQSSLWSVDGSPSITEVECTTVDEIPEKPRVHVIKMDIEGGEIYALRGMERTLSNTDKVIMFVECNPSALSCAGGSVDMLLEQLEGFGFRIQAIDEENHCLIPARDEIYAAENVNNSKYYVNLYCHKGRGPCP